MYQNQKLIKMLTILLSVIFMASCAPNEEEVDDAASESLSGTVMFGAVSGASVGIYELNADGSLGEAIDSTTTNELGQYTFQNRYRFHGPHIIVSKGGSYIDEASGEEVIIPDDYEISSAVADGESVESVAVNPLTAMVAIRARHAVSGDLESTLLQAETQVKSLFGLDDVSLSTDIPDDLTSEESAAVANQNRVQSRYGMIVGSLSQMGLDQGLSAQESLKLMLNLGEDFKDGKFDGLSDGAALSHSLAVSPLQAMQQLSTAVTNYGNCNRNRTQLRAGDFSFSFGEIPQ